MCREFALDAQRLERLHRYAQGRHDVLTRVRADGLPNIRMPHAFGRYIAQMTAGYLISQPVRYESAGQNEGMRAFLRLLHAMDSDAVDVELAMDQAVFGRAVSLCFEGEEGPRTAALDPRSAFVVYDDTVEHRPLFGITITPRSDEAGRPAGADITAYTERHAVTYTGRGGQEVSGVPRVAAHGFARVPMVEYRNDEHGRGDFEDVLPLINAYDLLQSDRMNDRAQFADALLVLTGVMGIGTPENPTDFRAGMQRLRQDKTLSLPDSDARADWLVKTPLENDIDVLRNALAGDIHKFSMTPDFGDERFAGNVSGVAIKYKLFCLEQKMRIKERWFVRGLRERARVLTGWMALHGQIAPDVQDMRIRMERRLPESDLERAQTLNALRGILPDQALRDNAPLWPDDGHGAPNDTMMEKETQ